MDKISLAERALEFATMAHAGQKRRVTGADYITHPIRVAEMVAAQRLPEEFVAIAYLHDVVEDCDVSVDQLDVLFGHWVADGVYRLTKPLLGEGNRATRTAKFIASLKDAPRYTQIIKLCDRLDNLKELAGDKPDFVELYCGESLTLVDAIGDADPVLKVKIQDEVGRLLVGLHPEFQSMSAQQVYDALVKKGAKQ